MDESISVLLTLLQATTLADITNSAGTHLAECVTNPKYAYPSQCSPTLKYPNQVCPSTSVWNEFIFLLQMAFTEGTTNKLRQPLGSWYCGCIHQSWNQIFGTKSFVTPTFTYIPLKPCLAWQCEYTNDLTAHIAINTFGLPPHFPSPMMQYLCLENYSMDTSFLTTLIELPISLIHHTMTNSCGSAECSTTLHIQCHYKKSQMPYGKEMPTLALMALL